MSEKEKTNHWDLLASELGATPPSEEHYAQPEPAPEPSKAESSPEEAGRTTFPDRRSSPPRRPSPPTQSPKRGAADWDALAGELGLAREDLPPEPPPEEPPAKTTAGVVQSEEVTEEPIESTAGLTSLFEGPFDLVEEPAETAQEPLGVAAEAIETEAKPIETKRESVEAEADLVGAVEELAETAPTQTPTRRRRKRKKKLRRPEEDLEKPAEPQEQPVELPDEVPVAAADQAIAEAVAEAEEEGPERQPSKRRRPRRGKKKKGVEADEGTAEKAVPAKHKTEAVTAKKAVGDSKKVGREKQGDEETDTAAKTVKPPHRSIPTWEEAVGLIVSANMENRKKSPGGSSRGRTGTRGSGGQWKPRQSRGSGGKKSSK